MGRGACSGGIFDAFVVSFDAFVVSLFVSYTLFIDRASVTCHCPRGGGYVCTCVCVCVCVYTHTHRHRLSLCSHKHVDALYLHKIHARTQT